ncbi:DnaD domain protein [Enterococcus caccae]|uniref:DnaD domain-containing protein n=1 Tax=Enterococcus caccae ATCC BAA-1240 TaxID=1158612 RepID=R3TVZ7_9ENTE|nr:DnaD domain protein [Enterococcus caccae]EOL45779.1 DnaD domain-containing protein [Enterococcus caccae ATCC BAA-1240]EOT60975.1 hypothetical protein I580_01877 [Enterococcus caccae ATCC BAA-1240]OJG27990.1 DnaD domain-containing protein [Enterococcus caccae]
MARKKKQTVDYFPHMANSGKTLFILENSFGNDGYAFWFKLLELIASTDGHVIDVGNSAEWRFLLAKTRVNEETANNILNMLAELDAIDLELWKEKVIWATNFMENVGDVYLRRKVAKPRKPDLKNKCQHNSYSPAIIEAETEHNKQDVDINQQSKVKESKVNKSKVKESSNKDDSDDLKTIFRFYESNGFGTLGQKTMQDFEYWIKDFIEIGATEGNAIKIILAAISEAVDYNKRSYAYINRILQDWEQKRYLTIDDVKAGQKKIQADKNNQQPETNTDYDDLDWG